MRGKYVHTQKKRVSDCNMASPVQQVLELENEMAKLQENVSVSRHDDVPTVILRHCISACLCTTLRRVTYAVQLATPCRHTGNHVVPVHHVDC